MAYHAIEPSALTAVAAFCRLLFRGATLGLTGCRADFHPGGAPRALGPREAAQEGLRSAVPPRLRGPAAPPVAVSDLSHFQRAKAS